MTVSVHEHISDLQENCEVQSKYSKPHYVDHLCNLTTCLIWPIITGVNIQFGHCFIA